MSSVRSRLWPSYECASVLASGVQGVGRRPSNFFIAGFASTQRIKSCYDPHVLWPVPKGAPVFLKRGGSSYVCCSLKDDISVGINTKALRTSQALPSGWGVSTSKVYRKN